MTPEERADLRAKLQEARENLEKVSEILRMAKHFNLADVDRDDPGLWRRFRLRASHDRIPSIRAVMITLMDWYASGRVLVSRDDCAPRMKDDPKGDAP